MTSRSVENKNLPRPIEELIIEAQVMGEAFHNPILLAMLIRTLRVLQRESFSLEEYHSIAAIINSGSELSPTSRVQIVSPEQPHMS